MSSIVIGVSGDEGSFSEEAGLGYAKKHHLTPQLVYLTDMAKVLAAVEARQIELGIFPVMNFRGGWVRMAFEAMGKHRFVPVDQFLLTVHQCLLVKKQVKAEQIQAIVSHPQALIQCEHYLAAHYPQATLIEWEDTAKAAKDLALGKLPDTHAVIAPERAATLYGLQLLEKHIEDDVHNRTLFIIVKGCSPSC